MCRRCQSELDIGTEDMDMENQASGSVSGDIEDRRKSLDICHSQ